MTIYLGPNIYNLCCNVLVSDKYFNINIIYIISLSM